MGVRIKIVFSNQMFNKKSHLQIDISAISSFLKIDEITSAREKTGELEKRGESQFI